MKSSQFGPALHEVWRRASTETIRINTGKGENGRKQGVALRHRLYQLRRCLEKESNPIAVGASRVSLHLKDIGEEGWVILASVADTKFDDLLASSGITVPEAPEIQELLMPNDVTKLLD